MRARQHILPAVGSHSVHHQVRLEERPDGSYDAQLVLACGCEVSLKVPKARTVELVSGEVRVAGKYPCPKGHLPRRP